MNMHRKGVSSSVRESCQGDFNLILPPYRKSYSIHFTTELLHIKHCGSTTLGIIKEKINFSKSRVKISFTALLSFDWRWNAITNAAQEIWGTGCYLHCKPFVSVLPTASAWIVKHSKSLCILDPSSCLQDPL